MLHRIMLAGSVALLSVAAGSLPARAQGYNPYCNGYYCDHHRARKYAYLTHRTHEEHMHEMWRMHRHHEWDRDNGTEPSGLPGRPAAPQSLLSPRRNG